MKDILDFDPDKKAEKKISSRAKTISAGALVIMFVGSILQTKYLTVLGARASVTQLMFTALIFVVFYVGVSIIFDLLSRIFFRKNRSKIFSIEFILKNINSAFAIWLILNLIVVSDKFLS